jgi:hypothetical protein
MSLSPEQPSAEPTEPLALVTTRLPAADITEIERLARRERRTRSNMMTVLIAEALATRRKTQP